jgi:hypothetical protein
MSEMQNDFIHFLCYLKTEVVKYRNTVMYKMYLRIPTMSNMTLVYRIILCVVSKNKLYEIGYLCANDLMIVTNIWIITNQH